MKKKFIIFIFIFTMVSLTVFAAEKIVIISVPEDWSTALVSVKELLKESYNDIGYEVRFVELPLSRSMVELINGRIDGELLNSKDIVRKYGLTLVNPPYFIIRTRAYYLKEKFKRAPTIDEIKKGKIGYLRGSAASDSFFIDAKSPTKVNNEKQLISLLNKERVDFVISMNSTFAIKEKTFGEVLLFETSIHHVLSKNNRELAKKIEPALKKNMAKGKYNHLSEQVKKLILKESE